LTVAYTRGFSVVFIYEYAMTTMAYRLHQPETPPCRCVPFVRFTPSVRLSWYSRICCTLAARSSTDTIDRWYHERSILFADCLPCELRHAYRLTCALLASITDTHTQYARAHSAASVVNPPTALGHVYAQPRSLSLCCRC